MTGQDVAIRDWGESGVPIAHGHVLTGHREACNRNQ